MAETRVRERVTKAEYLEIKFSEARIRRTEPPKRNHYSRRQERRIRKEISWSVWPACHHLKPREWGKFPHNGEKRRETVFAR